jgi:hypothetical protein
VSFATARFQWEEGARYVAAAPDGDRRAIERISDRIVDELRRRLGGPFTTEELSELYLRDGTDWCFSIATRTAPNEPAAWDMTTVAGAAFARYLRQASDYGGGRRLADED